jgi:hypothetical protein
VASRRRTYNIPESVRASPPTPPHRKHFETKTEAMNALEPGWVYGQDNPISIRGKEIYAIYKRT